MNPKLNWGLLIGLIITSNSCFLAEEPIVPSNRIYNAPEWRSANSYPYPSVWGAGFAIESTGKAYVGMTFSVNRVTYVDSFNTIISGGFTNTFWEYDPKLDKWSKLKNFPGNPTNYAVGFNIGDKGYYLGEGGEFWEYDPKNDSWKAKLTYPEGAIDAAVGFSIGHKGYVGLGIDNQNKRLSSFYEFDPNQGDKGQWNKMENLDEKNVTGTGFRSGAVAFSIDGKGYVSSGHTYSQKGNEGKYIVLNDLWEFDPLKSKGEQWRPLPNGIPQARDGGSAFIINGKAYVGGGTDGVKILTDFWEFDPNSGTWRQGKIIPGLGIGIGRLFPVAFALENKGYIGLGTFDPNINNYRFSNDFQIYTPYSLK